MPELLYKLVLFAAVLGLTSWGLHALRLRWGLAVRYYLLVGTTGLVALMVFNVSVPWFGRIPVLGDAISYWHIIMWFAVSWHSGVALFHPARVPLLLSLPCLFVSGFFCLMLCGTALLWVFTGGKMLSI